MRAWLLTALFGLTYRLYALTKRGRTPWGLSSADLLGFPDGTLGHALGRFLADRRFELMPRLEQHDVMHLLAGVDTDVVSEVELQCVLFGNGKRSPYLLATLAIGCALYAEHLGRFRRAVRRGGELTRFYDVDAHTRLSEPLERALPCPVASRRGAPTGSPHATAERARRMPRIAQR